MSNPSKKTDNKNSAKKQLDLYSYTGKVKFFDKDKGFGYIQEIPDAKNLDNVVKEWRVTAEQLGNTIIHRGDFVYFMKHGKTIGDISPINFRDLLKTPCPKCGRRDYIPGKNSVCKHCGHQFDTNSNFNDSRDNDPAFNCLVGTDMDVPCPTCGKHAWKKYGYHENIRCRCCGSSNPKINEVAIKTFMHFIKVLFGVVVSILLIILFVIVVR